MCGIAAIVGRELTPAHPGIEAMVAALAHRGPDADGIARLDGCHLGHARLSILDLAGGAQPMTYAGRYWITFNGEIYNHAELRDELIRLGHRFATRSDTEVILAAYAQWGEACLDRLRGMWAFAIWDARERALFASRDLFGEKPLYYGQTPEGTLLFASEIKSLLASGALTPRLDRSAVDAFLALGYVPPHRTIYTEIRTLPPGHWMTWRDGRARVVRYWRPGLAPEPMDIGEAAEALRARVDVAVRRQMTADVPVGAFLSGGHDSSTIVALMGQHSTRPVQTFSVGFGRWIDERPYARAVAKQYGTEHHEVDLGAPDVGALLERMARVYDEPFMDASHIPTFLIAEFARRRVKVVLTGDGADELFGGYAWYPLIAAAAAVPGSLLAWLVLRSASRMIGDRVAALVLYSRALGLAARTADTWQRYVRYRLVFGDAERRALWAGEAPATEDWLPRAYYRQDGRNLGFDAALYFDLAAFLPGDILVKVDRAAMAHGLETRAPFLDRDVVELALRLPAALKVSGRKTKIAFKRAFADLWPPALAARGKQGFAGPHERWLERPDVAALERRVCRPDSALSRLLPGIAVDAGRTSQQRWNLLTLGLWLESRARA
ncbi:asparagine synthase [Sulfurifustis variabilis]|uniref:asparagine synthase (glutamine-hydrolyzing) n=1 Tax=Sulfurifustis variabilis TaxID=1675686 RepID=A0A1B4V3Z9_9GAMM|nr:asparagine synthase (glutamine-hydrolyzing) [Sulfurifustis variabilis]BAU48095.1 asparagine synthase [Sulfurifustis variabilis]